MDPGKVDGAFFAEHIYPRLGADRADVRLGPTHGADFGVVDVGSHVVALATDPVFVLRELGAERAAWFAFHVAVSDAALSGIPPSHLSIDLNLPPDTTKAAFGTLWEVFDREARELGISIATGHTGTYAGCAWPTVGAATALAVGDPDDLVLPTGATPGDRLVCTKGPAIETTGILSVLYGDALDLDSGTVDAGTARFREASPVRDALTAAAAGPVTAMHDATERGVDNALHELAAASGVRLAAERERFPVGEGVREVCDAFGVDPWTASSEGTVLVSVRPDGVDDVLDALADEGVRAAAVGDVREGGGVEMDGAELDEPSNDPFWGAYERGRERYGVRTGWDAAE
ncbi:AIR synthase family protein [Halarchaeum nitratireducens]|uniref:Hydrogenase expression protein n=1 Tax=Halarchaeum nitratireducens TaxID=489913 RepID=A0A830GAK4_9EURY|nr:AIR synthase family protein [Halarchaeum nitratireducens]GGN13271.1 hydrogenase expression protein [Halarchaeum nitratireducens]